MAALTISDAAKAIGHSSRSQLYLLIQDGRLDDFVRYHAGMHYFTLLIHQT